MRIFKKKVCSISSMVNIKYFRLYIVIIRKYVSLFAITLEQIKTNKFK